uniref:Uncharacterized protein n=1 Tax=Heterorhabditis bacteriophora TaxID=37862 RepID=A0A1I7WH45_HETBA
MFNIRAFALVQLGNKFNSQNVCPLILVIDDVRIVEESGNYVIRNRILSLESNLLGILIPHQSINALVLLCPRDSAIRVTEWYGI